MPSDPAQLYAEAVSHFTAGRTDKAEELCRALVRAQPGNADVHNLLGLCLRRAGRHDQALAEFERAGALNRTLAPVHLNRGLTLIDLGRMDQAQGAFRDALACDPESAPAHFHLGVTLHQAAQFEEAGEHFRIVLAKDPRHANSHALAGLGLLLQGRIAEAKASLEAAAALAPNVATIHDGLGVVAADEGRVEDALAHFDKALSLDEQFAPAHFNRAASHLRRGDLERGLPELEWRWRLPRDARAAKMRDFPQPLWTGEHLGDAALLVWGEQGLGDEIRSAGVVDDVLRRGGRIVLECDPRLTDLLRRSLPDAQVVARRDPPSPDTLAPHVARQCPGDTLLRHVRPTLAEFPHRPAYLKADSARISAVQAGLPKRRPVVGVSWGSWNTQFARGKAVALSEWKPILTRANITFVDLQYGDTVAERAAAQRTHDIALTHLPDLDLTTDIDGLAALISACDLVITVSNTTAHLAGALGVPTWVMLPFGHFQPWYWLSDRTDSPWYPSVRLYRQSKFGDWPAVIRRIASDLDAWADAPRAPLISP